MVKVVRWASFISLGMYALAWAMVLSFATLPFESFFTAMGCEWKNALVSWAVCEKSSLVGEGINFLAALAMPVLIVFQHPLQWLPLVWILILAWSAILWLIVKALGIKLSASMRSILFRALVIVLALSGVVVLAILGWVLFMNMGVV